MSLPSSEQWRPIPGYEGFYEASDQGRVRSLDREFICSTGHRSRRRGRILKPKTRARSGHLDVNLSKHDHQKMHAVHQLVLSAFVGPRPEGLEVRHRNGNPADNRLTNIVYDTRSENHRDRVRHGTHWQSLKTHCPQGHPYSGENLLLWNGGRDRRCRTCHRAHTRQTRERARAAA